jgi:hypothetical protein
MYPPPLFEQVQRSVHLAIDLGEGNVPHFVYGSMILCDGSNKSYLYMSSDFLQMLIFSLGRVLQRAVQNTDLEGRNLEAVLESMVHPNPAVRASLMDLFDVSMTVTPVESR